TSDNVWCVIEAVACVVAGLIKEPAARRYYGRALDHYSRDLAWLNSPRCDAASRVFRGSHPKGGQARSNCFSLRPSTEPSKTKKSIRLAIVGRSPASKM